MLSPYGIHLRRHQRDQTASFAGFRRCPFAAAALAAPVDINTADATALEEVKGIGPHEPRRSWNNRTANGPFASVDDLTKVSGIGDKSVNQLRDQVTVSAAKKPVAKAKAK